MTLIMKFNIAYPQNGTNKVIEIADQAKLNALYNLRICSELEGESLGDAFAGYVFKITGGNDKQGFTMNQGVLTNTRVRLLLAKGHSCYRPRRKGERKRKSVRGCVVGPDIQVLALIVLKVGEKDIDGLTNVSLPNRLGPKRASKIRKLFDLGKDDDVCDFVVTRCVEKEKDGVVKKRHKRPKIQRLVTRQRRIQKRNFLREKKNRLARKKAQIAFYKKLKAEKKAKA